MLPSLAPLQLMLKPPDTVEALIVDVIDTGSVKVMLLLVEQPFASVTVTS